MINNDQTTPIAQPADPVRIGIIADQNTNRILLNLVQGETPILERPLGLTPDDALRLANKLRGLANKMLHEEFKRAK